MKISLSIITSLSAISNVEAFGMLPQSSRCSPSTLKMHFADEVEEAPKKELTVYDRLGFEEEKVAVGINANEVRNSIKLHNLFPLRNCVTDRNTAIFFSMKGSSMAWTVSSSIRLQCDIRFNIV